MKKHIALTLFLFVIGISFLYGNTAGAEDIAPETYGDVTDLPLEAEEVLAAQTAPEDEYAPGGIQAMAASTVPVPEDTSTKTVFRFYNKKTIEHLFTTAWKEALALYKTNSWVFEGVSFISPLSGKAVYRLYNGKEHHYTKDKHEVKVLTARYGWKADFDGKPAFYSGGSTSVYRLYNKKLNIHHLTQSVNEKKTLVKRGWKYEGVAFKAMSNSDIGRTAGSAWIVRQYGDISNNQAMFYSLYNCQTKKLIIIDGGGDTNETYVRSVIALYGKHVNAWILTHYHPDHIGAFNKIYANPKGIVIDSIIASSMDLNKYHQVALPTDHAEVFDAFAKITKGVNITYPQRGETFDICGITTEFFNTYDQVILDNNVEDIPNNCSLMFKMTMESETFLFMGDCASRKLSDYILENFGDRLKADYLQTGHHGNNGFATSFYEAVDAHTAFFDAPDWLVTGSAYKAKDLLAYYKSLGSNTFDFRSGIHEVLLR